MMYETGSSKGAAELAAYYLQKGKGTHAYRYFGVHRLVDMQGWSYVFRVAAPGADAISLVGEWNGWQSIPMQREEGSGVWELVWRADICPEGLRYKYRVQKGERVHDKADPYARMSESGGEGASMICTESHYAWQDSAYLAMRAQRYADHVRYAYPMHIYEVDPARWLGEDGGVVPSYRAIGDLLAQYAADMGYTHLLLRFPGLQSGGKDDMITRFAPDAALGTPDDFAYFVDRMHKQGIGVLLEMECRYAGAHASGLCNFDGNGLYTQDSTLQYADPYATALLYSGALYWLREYHADGLYINAEGMPAGHDTGELLRTLVASVRAGVPDALLLLRASGYRGLSVSQSLGGLGYDFILDSSVEAALLDCFAMSPTLRVGRQAWRTAAQGLFAEDALVALSSALTKRHAGSVMGSIEGEFTQKFATARLLFLFMICLPGKKLTFMGNELGQESNAAGDEGVEWLLKQIESHAELHAFVSALNAFYLQTPPLWECDTSKEGVCSVECIDAPEGVFAFKRFDRAGREVCAVFCMGEQSACGVRLAIGGRYPYYCCVFHTNPTTAPARLQTDGNGCVMIDLDASCGMLLVPDAPMSEFWFENA